MKKCIPMVKSACGEQFVQELKEPLHPQENRLPG